MKLYPVLILLLVGSIVSGQNISGVVNTYHKVNAINTTTNTLTLSSAAGLSPGVKVLIIQMKGATIDNTNTATFGNITSLGNAGNYEFNYVCGVNGNDILLVYSLQRTYTVSGLVQLVTVPRYTDAVVTDTLKAAPWNATTGTGGIIAIEAVNSISLLAPIDANGAGFKGGTYIDHPPPYNCDWSNNITSFFLANPPASVYQLGGSKGEGISTLPANMEMGKGKLANGGGGGNNHNAGGGGGGNYATGGSGGMRSNEGTFGCHAQHPGVGGLGLSAYGYSTAAANNRVFVGGGGGAGQGNNNVGMPGGNGGGIVFLLTATLNGNNQLIRANGARPYRADLADPWSAGGDGGGGGGAGGVIVLNVNNYAGNVTAEAMGANGSFSSYTPSSGCFGPGGGGAGGVIWVSGAALNPLVDTSLGGGLNGLISATTSVVACRGLANGATPGTAGALITGYVPVASTALVCAPLPLNDLVYFTAKESDDVVELAWKMKRIASVRGYEVERSVDNVNYTTVNNLPNNGQFNYTLTDKNAPLGYVYYRLKVMYTDGTTLYAPVTTVYIRNQQDLQLLRLSPNPAGNTMTLVVKTAMQGNCEIEIYSNTAQKLFDKKYLVRTGLNQLKLQLEKLPAGVYLLHIRQDGRRVVRSFVKADQP
ncbi:MAG TPA: T9SS type A sorting domain-containing protein [Chitinophagaceae bacterium]|nr:T9SS type A sorting domain-containing protein [Chitinophagaceae bacterium]